MESIYAGFIHKILEKSDRRTPMGFNACNKINQKKRESLLGFNVCRK